jgi:gelsolin
LQITHFPRKLSKAMAAVEAKQTKYADSNIALFGSDFEKKVKLESAQHEQEWVGAGSKVGLEIWHVEQFHIKRVPKEAFGKFYDGDSYIVLNTYKKPGSDKLLYDVHFWLGNETSQDEAGTAAYKTVELDTLLNGLPVQYREVQGFESQRFLSYFKHMQIMHGGIASGFHHVAPENYAARLLHFKGKTHIRAWEVPLERASLNDGDVFLLDAGLKVWLWEGNTSRPRERIAGNSLLEQLKEERNFQIQAQTLNANDDEPEFWKLLGGKGPVADASAGGDDAEAEVKHSHDVKLLRVKDSGVEPVADGDNLSLDSLVDDGVFILDTGLVIMLWVGQHAHPTERSKAMAYAIDYLQKINKPQHTQVVCLPMHGETPEFMACFKSGAIKNCKSH